MAITYTKPGTASDLRFIPLDAEGNQVAVDGLPAVVLSEELDGLLSWEPDASGFAGRLVAAADLGDEVRTGTFTASVDADVSDQVATLVGVLQVNINPAAAMATVLDIQATDPV